MKIGFIGLGIMGKPMANNLIKAGHEVLAYDIVPACCEDAKAMGAQIASSSKAVAAECGVIITMLPNSPHCKTVILGEDGVLEGAKPGTIIIDMSSIAPLASKEINEACAEKGVRMLDAPVSGGEAGAIAGSLSIMVGGDEGLFGEMKDLLLTMGASAVYCGGPGAGNTTKLANQVVVAINIAAVSEAFLLGKMAGVDPQFILDAIKGGLAGSAVMNAKIPMVLNHNYAPGFRVDLHIKDLQNALETAHEVGAPLLLSAQVMEMLQRLRADGCGSEDHAAIAKFYEKLAGETIGC